MRLSISAAVVFLTLISCQKSQMTACDGLNKGVFIRQGCRGLAIEMINFNLDVQKNWSDVFNASKDYQNVLTINNHLPYSKSIAGVLNEMNVGDTIIMDLKPSLSTVNCLVADGLPDIFYEVTNVEICARK